MRTNELEALRQRQDAQRHDEEEPPATSEAEIRAHLRQLVRWNRPLAPRGRPLCWWVANQVRDLRESHTNSITRTRRFGWK